MSTPIRLLPCLLWLCAATAVAEDIEIRAELVEAEGLTEEGADKIIATGDVRITAGDLTLYAPELTWTRDKARALLTGGVVGVDGAMFMHADSVDADLQTDDYALERGEVLFKKKVAPAELARLTETDPDAALKCGVNSLTLRAKEVGRQEENLEARKVWMTTCECAAGCRPMFSITASSADIVPDERATLKWPVFWLFDLVPLFPPLPQLTLPLVDRKTGLLFPQFAFSGPGGVGIDIPYFITLGESADVTVTGQWFRGDRDDETGEFLDRSVRGFGAITEFRWRPAEEAAGSLLLSWIHDVVPDKTTGQIRGHRGTVALAHSQALLAGRLGLESRFASDTSAARDRSLALDAERAYLRTRATWTKTGRHLGTGVSTSAIQDLRPQRISFFETPAVLAPVAHASVQGHGAVGPAFADATLSFIAQRTAPGLELELAPGREALNVISARVGQAMPLVNGVAGLVALEAGQRVDLQARLNGDTQWRGGGFAGLWARTRFGRTFGNGMVHDVLPSIRLRGFAVAGAPYASNLFVPREQAPQAAVDVALPSTASVQLVTRLASTLTSAGGKRVAASIEHHLTLAPMDLGQVVGDLSIPLGPTRLWGGASMRLVDRKITQATGGWSGRGKYAGISFSGQYLAGTLNDRLASGLDMLFTPPEGVVADRSDRLVTGGGSLNFTVPFFEALTARAGAAVSRSLDAENSEWKPNAYAQFGYGVGGCGRLSVGLEWAPEKDMGVTFNFELSDLTEAVRTASR